MNHTSSQSSRTNSSAPAALQYATPPLAPEPGRLLAGVWPVYLAEALSSVGGNVLMVGIFYYMQDRFGWRLRDNFVLASCQGAGYVIGALLASPVSKRLGRRRTLLVLFALISLIIFSACFAKSSRGVVVVLMLYPLLGGMTWPILEAILSAGADAHTMSRRLGLYNILWSITGAATIAVVGWIIDHWSIGIFVLGSVCYVLSTLAMLALNKRHEQASEASIAPPHLTPEPQLLRMRKLALWLSRISLPAGFVVIYSISPMMPTLKVMQPLDTTMRTLVGCTWLVARSLAFVILTATVAWHRRPRLLLWAAFAMFVASLGIMVRPTDAFGVDFGYTFDLTCMILAQILLGLGVGMVYSGSLYFGMVLSEGSTEHGGYHEALIGVGSIIGPGAGAIAQYAAPDNPKVGIATVACVIGMTVLLALGATIVASSRESKERRTT